MPILRVWNSAMRPPPLKEGDSILISQNTGAGLAHTPAVVLKVCPKRYHVRWLDTGIGHGKGDESYVPKWACFRDERASAPLLR